MVTADSRRIDLEMEGVAEPKPRKTILRDAVNEALNNAFNDPKARESFLAEATRCFGTKERDDVEGLLTGISKVLKQSVQAHVDNWTAQRGLDQTLDIVDVQCLRAALPLCGNVTTAHLMQPSTNLPNTSFAQVRLNCKKQQLEEMKQDLAERTSQLEQLKAEVAQQIEAASALSRSVGRFGDSANGAP